MPNISELKKEFSGLMQRISYGEAASLISTSLLGALVFILFDLNKEAMADTGQWLPTKNALGLLIISAVLYGLMLFLPLAMLYRKTQNLGSDERDWEIYRKAGANSFYLLQGLIALALLWFWRHGNGLLLFNTIIAGLITAFAVFFFLVYVRYRAISPSILTQDDD